MKTTMKTLAALLGVSLLSLIPAKAVDVTFDRNVAADFSTTDSLQGLNATVGTGWAMYIGIGPDGLNGQNIAANGKVTSRLTDASSADAPTLSVLAGDNTVDGSQFVVQTSTDLASWTEVPGTGDANLVNTSSSVAYTLSGSGKKFVRLKVTP
jgi:hypothetical protein